MLSFALKSLDSLVLYTSCSVVGISQSSDIAGTAQEMLAHHLEHEPGNDFSSLSDVTRKVLFVLVSKVDHDGAGLEHRQILLIVINCTLIANSIVNVLLSDWMSEALSA